MSPAAYDRDLARIHDEGYGGFISALMPEVLQVLRDVPRNALVIDVGCGAGVSTRALLDDGFRVLAIEPSAALRERARARAPEATFDDRSVYELELPSAAAIVALGEPLTYHRLEADGWAALEGFFTAAHRSLAPGGVLAFDLLVTGASLARTGLRSAAEWTIGVEITEPAPDRLVREIVTFVAEPSGLFRRAHERHEVQRFEQRAVVEALQRVGFERAEVLERLGAATMLPSRRLFVARRETSGSPTHA